MDLSDEDFYRQMYRLWAFAQENENHSLHCILDQTIQGLSFLLEGIRRIPNSELTDLMRDSSTSLRRSIRLMQIAIMTSLEASRVFAEINHY